MRILFVTHHYLDSDGGGSFASRAFANAFCDLAETAVILYPDRGIKVQDFVNNKYHFIGIQNKKYNIIKLADIYMGRIHRFHKDVLLKVSEYNPDLLIFDNSRCSYRLIKKINRLNTKIIVIHHNFEAEYYKANKVSLFWRYILLFYVKRAERQAFLNSDLNLVLTNQDAELFKRAYDLKGNKAIENIGVFEYNYNKSINIFPNKEKQGYTFVITGSLNAKQTEISIFSFIEKYLPVLLKIYPNSKIIIAGQKPSYKLLNICCNIPNIEIIANPSDMSIILARADIYLCPISVGGGMKLRIMDGLKHGLPVLTHSISARGYDDFLYSGYLFSYDCVESFETSLIKISNFSHSAFSIKSLYNLQFSYYNGLRRLQEILDRHSLL